MSLPTLIASLYGDLFSTASISETPEGGLLVQSAPSRYVAWVLAFPVILLVSRWCWRRGIGGNLAPGFFFTSFLIPTITVPMLALESVRVTPQQLTIRTGFWFSPTVREVNLTQVTHITERHGVASGSSHTNQTPKLRWYFLGSDGTWQSISLPDLLEANRRPAADYLGRHGHPVEVSQSSP